MDKLIRIDEQTHRRIKAGAAMRGQSLKDYTEALLRRALDNGDKRTTDSRTPYRVETEEA